MKSLAITLFYVSIAALYLSSPAPAYVAAGMSSIFHSLKCTLTTCPAPVAVKVKKEKKK